MKKSTLLLLLPVLFFSYKNCSAQYASKTDSLIKIIMSDDHVTDLDDKGITLLASGNLSAAGNYFNTEIKNDEGSKKAYFGRGIVHWVTNDTMSACKDWSALLALGDTAAFKLLDSHCHGAMTIENDVIPKATYHKMFAVKKEDRATASNQEARTMAEVMPEFMGGTPALLSYFSHNIRYPASAKAKKVQGTVYVNFVVSSTGKILFPYITRGLGSGCDEEALRLIKAMPAWIPGKQKGKPVLVRFNLPVSFRIK